MKQDVTVELAGGKQIKFETGRMAKQAPGAAFTTCGDNAVLATATASPDPKEGIDFFPLTVEYREFTYAGGRIPGGFIKREGRPSEKEDSDQPADRPPDSSSVSGDVPERDAGGRVCVLGGQGERPGCAGDQRG